MKRPGGSANHPQQIGGGYPRDPRLSSDGGRGVTPARCSTCVIGTCRANVIRRFGLLARAVRANAVHQVMDSFLVGHPRVVSQLSRAMAQERLAHALLFVGPKGVGRETCAVGLAAGLLCDAEKQLPRPLFGCGTCRSCTRVHARNHPDLHWVMSEAEASDRGVLAGDNKRRPSRGILVDQVRELSRVMRMKPYEGRAKVAVIVDAHLMNQNAANALLKTLEEPAPATWLVLLAPHPRAILPTLLSRCQRITFGPLGEEDVASVLQRLGASDVPTRAKLGEGSVARALALDLQTEQETSSRAMQLLQRIQEDSGTAQLNAAEEIGRDRDGADRVLDGLLSVVGQRLRELIAQGVSPGATEFRDLRRAAEAVMRSRRALAENAHVQLTLESLLSGGFHRQ